MKNGIHMIVRLFLFLLALPFMKLTTWQDYRDAAKAAILEGNLEQAATYKDQAVALKSVGELDDEEETPEPGAARSTEPAPAAKGAPLTAPNIKRETNLGFSDDPMQALKAYIRKNDHAAARAALQEDTDSEGGYLVPADFHDRIVEKRNKMSIARAMGAQVITTSLKVVNVPVENTEATDFVRTAEEAAADENEPTFNSVDITAHRYTKLVKVSDELISDQAANLEDYLANVFARKEATTENQIFLTGTGTGEPQGALTASTLGVTAAGATAITAAEVKALYYSLPSQYRQEVDNVAWAMNDTVEGVIRSLQGSNFLFSETPGGSQRMGDLLTRRVFNADTMPAMTAGLKPLLIGNWWYYMIVERQALSIRRLSELYAVNGQIGLLATFRRGGAVTQAAAFRHLKQAAS
jgi:HK97 family phage major capsid protein